ncbi:hypothetical protein [Legionella longbeachae]|uniref:Uncharacterized protein n=1 Tax=Legionella longbeachae serogroup 1 (strain NSW150) TaxID=661367 RepID=D3HKS1_LEGLN|nr:hypothetical protein [Legionella longbeachae]VEE03551.1 Uncharacterised protein [Legionella oakridgensis]HBD7397828.1 hypothetical protein [Legionella pneumophila]ARB93562.1 hypothetical protein A6J40_15900 [Legionella longbeachae]ARM33301.1 hypothetical protein B0B39_07075 [Legionella longbeachae]EEZ93833.1 conserved hypothetical protein [Legionella longbeachae D-4968]
MKNQKELFEFLSQLIDIQIKKYITLTTEKVVQDARYNTKLVFAEINELLGFAEQLVTDMENPSASKLNDSKHFGALLNQVKFYLEQEHTRAYAGWILDEKNSTSEIEKQLIQLHKIGKSAGIDCSSASIAVTETQKLCEYDSAQIAFQVFDLVKKIKENPDMDLDNSIPKQAQIRLKHNAKTRYSEKEFAESIDGIHLKFLEFFEQSALDNNPGTISKEEAGIHEEKHRNQWESLLQRYQAITNPSKPSLVEKEEIQSPVRTSDEHQITIPPKEKKIKIPDSPDGKKPEPNSYLKNSIFYSGLAFAGAVAVYMLMTYFTKGSKSDLGSILKP